MPFRDYLLYQLGCVVSNSLVSNGIDDTATIGQSGVEYAPAQVVAP